MKRKDYHQRLLISASVETDRWKDFQDLCDKERKSYSLKINELIAEELQKNALGSENPIGVSYNTYVCNPKKSFQMSLDAWNTKQRAVQSIKGMDAQTIENIGLNMIYASRFKKTGIARDVRVF